MSTRTHAIPIREASDRAPVAGRIAPPLPLAPPPIPRQIPVDDPRWVLAIAVNRKMVGSTVRPGDRAKLLKMGRSMGLSVFATNLVIAVMQDAARRGRGPAGAIDELLVIPTPGPEIGRWRRVVGWVAALVVAEAAVLWWFLG